ncbi:MAG: DUF1189 domain-containing protein [Clostridiales bacterium]|nr:DUF1189 domain-containing protein [Clostridiales bacterium]
MYLLKSFIKSLYDFNYYKEIYTMKKWKGFLYLTILSFLLGLIIYLPMGFQNAQSYEQVYKVFADNCPDFIIEDNILKVDATSPYTIYDEADKGFLIMIDDSNTINEANYNDYLSLVLLEKDQLYLRMDTIDVTYTYSELSGFIPETIIDKSVLITYLSILKYTNVFTVALLLFFFMLLIQVGALIIGLFGNSIARFRKIPNLKLKDGYMIACFASTLPLLMITIILSLGMNFEYLQLIYVLIGVLYHYNGMKHVFPKEEI